MKRCVFCSAAFATSQELLSHIASSHGPKNSTKQDASNLDERKFKCDQCDRQYKNKRYLRRHKKEKHTSSSNVKEQRLFTCEDCNYSGTRKWNLLRHYRDNGHGGKQKKVKTAQLHPCQHCEQKFMRKDVLLSHVRRRHMPHHQDQSVHSSDEDMPIPQHRKKKFTPSPSPAEDDSDSASDEPTSSNRRELRRQARKRKHSTSNSETSDHSSEQLIRDQEEWKAHEDMDWDEIDKNDMTVDGLIKLTQQSTRKNRYLKASEHVREFRFTPFARELASNGQMLEVLYGVLRHLIGTLTINSKTGHFMQIVMDSPDELDYAIYGVMRPVDPDFHLQDFMERFARVLNSRAELSLSHDFRLTVRLVELPERLQSIGSTVLLRKHTKTFLEYLFAKKVTWSPGGIGGQDCLIKCLAAGLAVHEYGLKKAKKLPWWKKKGNHSTLQNLAEEISKKTGLSLDRKLTCHDFETLQLYLNQHYPGKELLIYDEIIDGKPRLFYPDNPQNAKFMVKSKKVKNQIIMAVADQHCFLITNFTTFAGKRKMCTMCSYLYDKDEHHSCTRICGICQQTKCDAKRRNIFEDHPILRCSDCDVHFQTKRCFRNHKKHNICENYVCHQVCGKIIKREHITNGMHEKVECLMRECNECKRIYKEDPDGVVVHQCSIEKPDIKKLGLPKEYRIINYDFEASPNEDAIHKPYCVTAIRSCQKCDDPKLIKLQKCINCGVRRHAFFGKTARNDFFDFLLFNVENEKAVALAHNGSSYDSYMALRYLLEQDVQGVETCCNVTRLMQVVAGRKVKLKDSYLFFGGSLRSLPKTFGFEDKGEKGFFPHKLDAFKYLDYDGKPFGPEHFMTENMTEEEYKRFQTWLSNQESFNFKEKSIEYCMNDTEVLTLATQYFQQQCVKDTGVSPFHHCITLAQFCATVFRTTMMNVDIGKVPPNGYSHPRNNSRLALKRLSFEAKKRGIEIQTAMNGKEIRINGRPVDGYFFNRATNEKEVWQVLGCYFHGCCDVRCKVGIKQRPDVEHSLLKPLTNFEVYNRTLNQLKQLKDLGYTVHIIWEHAVLEAERNDPEFKAHCEAMSSDDDFYTEIDPRDALYGTECMFLSKELTEEQLKNDWGIFYHDVVSLYPFVQLTAELPLGHPIVLSGCDVINGGANLTREEFQQYFGIAKVTIEPPKDLRFPILPMKLDDKLYFVLCNKCAQEKNKSDCQHNVRQRQLTGTWVTTEIDLALQHGYSLKQVHRVWHYKKRTKDAFKEYIMTFLKGKIESSGRPDENIEILRQFKETFEHLYTQDDGSPYAQLDIDAIEENPGKRLLCKIMLNSLWGKFCQALDRQGNLWINNYESLVKTLSDPALDITNMEFSAESAAFVTYRQKAGTYTRSHPMYNPVIGSFVTSSARQYMYKFMIRLGHQRLLYMDTDSFFWCGKKEEQNELLPIGLFPGQFTNELTNGKTEEFGTAFYSPGLKSYALQTNKNKVIARCKGIRNDQIAKTLITPGLMKALILGNVTEVLENYESLQDHQLKELLQLRTAMNADENAMAFFPYSQIQKIKSQALLRNRSGLKMLRKTFDKRRVQADLSTVPFGFSSPMNRFM